MPQGYTHILFKDLLDRVVYLVYGCGPNRSKGGNRVPDSRSGAQ